MEKKDYKDCLTLMLKDIGELQTEILSVLVKADKMSKADLAKKTEMLEGWLQDLS